MPPTQSKVDFADSAAPHRLSAASARTIEMSPKRSPAGRRLQDESARQPGSAASVTREYQLVVGDVATLRLENSPNDTAHLELLEEQQLA